MTTSTTPVKTTTDMHSISKPPMGGRGIIAACAIAHLWSRALSAGATGSLSGSPVMR